MNADKVSVDYILLLTKLKVALRTKLIYNRIPYFLN